MALTFAVALLDDRHLGRAMCKLDVLYLRVSYKVSFPGLLPSGTQPFVTGLKVSWISPQLCFHTVYSQSSAQIREVFVTQPWRDQTSPERTKTTRSPSSRARVVHLYVVTSSERCGF